LTSADFIVVITPVSFGPTARARAETGWESVTARHGAAEVERRRSPVSEWLDVMADEVADELAWQERALCAETDPEAFFPEKGGSTREAKKVCLSCDVRVECLEYALTHDERFGIWGGLSERERRRLRRAAAAAG
jgi:WhiB family redox-sensing transcriptional regulator